MFNVRARPATSKRARQFFELVEISAANADIPLQENWAERWCTLSENYQKFMDDILNFEIRDDDVFVVTFMKCGTSWMQETAWLVIHDLNFQSAAHHNISERSRHFDGIGVFGIEPNTLTATNETTSPRVIKTHLPANLLPKQVWQKKTKLIFVARNVKDVVVSCYNFMLELQLWSGTKDEFIEDFINNEIMYLPYWEQVIDFWQMRNEANVLFITYEDMKRDLPNVVKDLCKFLEKPALDDRQLERVVEHLSFDQMRNDKNSHITDSIKKMSHAQVSEDFHFMRRGNIGSYKSELTVEQQRKLNKWSNDILAKYGLKQADIFGHI